MSQPDLGSTAVVVATTLGMMFLGGARLKPFFIVISITLVGLVVLIVFAPYRLERLLSYLDPWKFAFDGGYQLVNALIAFGRGDWFGVGLGNSVQKIFYLPEAHTDFVISVVAEELGVVVVLAVIVAYSLLIQRAFAIGALAEQVNLRFQAFIAYGLGLWLGLQAFVNLGVNMGVLPTKGLTLPLMSYGGSSLIITCVAIGLLLRANFEVNAEINSTNKGQKKWVCM